MTKKRLKIFIQFLSRHKRLFLSALLLVTGVIFQLISEGLPLPKVETTQQNERAAVTLYFTDHEQRYLIPVSRRLKSLDEATPKRSLEELIRGPQAGPELTGLFPAETQLESFVIRGDTVKVNISGIKNETSLFARAVVLTLTEFPGIKKVELYLNGQSIDLSGNPTNHKDSLSRPNAINLETAGEGETKIILYFKFGEIDNYLVPVTRRVSDTEVNLGLVIAELLRGPLPKSNLQPLVPENVKLLGTQLDNGLAIIDFSDDLSVAYRLKQANQLLVRKAVIATVTQLQGVNLGQIYINGSSLVAYSCINITEELPQRAPWAINDEYYLSDLSTKSDAVET